MTGFDNDHSENHQLIIRGKPVGEDADGLICLDDIWKMSGGQIGKAPKFWRFTQGAKTLVAALKRKVGIANHFESALIRAERGRGSRGTFAHPVLAAAYAGYLSPKLEVEVREVWMRYRAGDASLADDILQRATAEANHWAGVRALSRSQRNSYTDTLKAHGVVEKGYMECTEAVYLHLLGGKSYQLRGQLGLPKGANLRNHLDVDKLA